MRLFPDLCVALRDFLERRGAATPPRNPSGALTSKKKRVPQEKPKDKEMGVFRTPFVFVQP
jgi:hypothetical protein